MSVSSVKNLNGETFSAVQDLELTNFVQTNSGSWTGTNLSGCVKYTDATLGIGSSNTTDNMGNNKGVFAQGISNTAKLDGFAQGETNSAYNSLAQGWNNKAKTWSLAQGRDNTAKVHSLAQGWNNTADQISLAQGEYNNASVYSIAQGNYNNASIWSIAQGQSTSASNYSQSFGRNTKATNSGMAIGYYNKTESAAFVVGNGNNEIEKSDAFIVYHDGSVSAAGKISANGVELVGEISLSSLNDAGVNNIIVTASLPATPDANTLYFIPET